MFYADNIMIRNIVTGENPIIQSESVKYSGGNSVKLDVYLSLGLVQPGTVLEYVRIVPT